MTLTGFDWAVVAAFFALNLAIGLAYARRGGSSFSEFFLSGRNVPWWLAGISMVATTFAVDTPLAVTGFVVSGAGILVACLTPNALLSVAWSCVAMFGLELTVGVAWAVPLDIGGDYAGSVSAVMN